MRKYRPEGYSCPVCDVHFRTPQSLGGHVTSVHTGVDLDWIIMEKERLKRVRKRVEVVT